MGDSGNAEPGKPRNLLILGAGGFAREVAAMVNNINQAQPGSWITIGYLERGTDRRGKSIEGVTVLNHDDLGQYSSDIYAVAAIGNPKLREIAVKDAEKNGFKYATLIHPSVILSNPQAIRIGTGSIVCAGCIITTEVTIGSHVIINLDCSIGHDAILEDYVTLSPGCHISGVNAIRRNAFLGTGAVTIEHCEIGARAIIGAGATVVGNIPEDVTAVGVPAKPVRK